MSTKRILVIDDFARNLLHTSKPSMPGMVRSRMARSGIRKQEDCPTVRRGLQQFAFRGALG